jgi:hypothetical protein
MRCAALVLAVGLILAMTSNGRGWETDTTVPRSDALNPPASFPWSAAQGQSIYAGVRQSPNPQTMEGFFNNEHAELSDLALQRIGAFGLGLAARERTVIDLNASLFRPELRKRGFGPRPDNTGLLEQRLLPAVPRWSGLPDFSYSIEDWINKNAFCPSRPAHAGGDDACYVYAPGWLGNFNSSHFGSQAAKNYQVLHAIALTLARRARNFHQTIITNGGPENARAHNEAINEAYYMALYYETVAQHFLQDRWATGHMWERWGAPDYSQSPSATANGRLARSAWRQGCYMARSPRPSFLIPRRHRMARGSPTRRTLAAPSFR